MAKAALVTGAARGIGRASALALAEAGFDIALVDLLAAQMAAAARDIEGRGVRTLSFEADVSDFGRARAIVEQTTRHGAGSTCCSTMPARRARSRSFRSPRPSSTAPSPPT